MKKCYVRTTTLKCGASVIERTYPSRAGIQASIMLCTRHSYRREDIMQFRIISRDELAQYLRKNRQGFSNATNSTTQPMITTAQKISCLKRELKMEASYENTQPKQLELL